MYSGHKETHFNHKRTWEARELTSLPPWIRRAQTIITDLNTEYCGVANSSEGKIQITKPMFRVQPGEGGVRIHASYIIVNQAAYDGKATHRAFINH